MRILPAFGLLIVASTISAPNATGRQDPTEELVLLFIANATGPWNTEAGFADVVREAKTELRTRARESGMVFVAVGVALDQELIVGWDYLVNGISSAGDIGNFGHWDEIHVGNAWRNAVVVQHVFRQDRQGMEQDVPIATIPQVLIFKRDFRTRQDGLDYGPDELLRRIMGVRALRKWLGQGAPLEPAP